MNPVEVRTKLRGHFLFSFSVPCRKHNADSITAMQYPTKYLRRNLLPQDRVNINGGQIGNIFNEQLSIRRMPSSGMLRNVALVRINVSKESSAHIMRVTNILRSVNRLLVTANVAPSSPILLP
jgi:hypothetical protein